MKRLALLLSVSITTSCAHLPFQEIDRAELLKSVDVLCIASDYSYASFFYSSDKGRGWGEALSSEYISEEARKMLESSGKTLLTQGLTDDDLDAFYDDYSLNSGSFSGVPELKECDATLFVYCQGGVHCQSYFVEGLGPGVQHCPVAEMNITTMLAVNGKAIANKRIHSRIVAPPGFPFRITASEVVEEPPLREAFETSEFRDVMDVYAEMLGAHSASPAD